MGDSKLYINGQEVPQFKEVWDPLREDDTILDLPGHILVDVKNSDKWIGDLTDEDCEKLFEVLRMDTDKFINKKVKIYIQVIGNKTQR